MKGGKKLKRKNVEVIQEEASDCGVSCLLSIIRYYNGDASLENMRISSKTTSKGVSAYNLIECAKQYGFDCVGLKIENIESINLPYIAHLNLNNTLSHFVVVYEVSSDNVLIMDPAYGFVSKDKKQFMKEFDHIAIRLYPKEKIIKETVDNILWKNIISEIKNCKFDITFMIILNIFLVFLSIIYSSYISLINAEYIYIIIFIILLIVIRLLEYLKETINIKILSKSGRNITKHFYHHIFYLPLKILHLKDSGEIIKRINELDEVKDVVNNFFISSILTFIYVISMLIAIFFVNVDIMLIIILSFISLIGITNCFYKKLKYDINEYLYSSTEYNKTLQNDILALESIKHLNQEKIFINKLQDIYEHNLNNSLEIQKKINKIELIKNLFLSILEILITFIMIIKHHKIEDIFIMNLMVNFLITSFNEFLNIIPSFSLESKIIRKINEFYNIKFDTKGNKKFSNGTIRFEDVSFSYNNYSKVLFNISFDILENEKVIIDGISGSGKSTLMKLLNRDYEDYEGNIYIDNQNIKDIDIDDFKKNVLYLSQNEKFINGTIKDNILFGRSIDEEKFKKIEKICRLDIIMEKYPLKYDTYIFNDNNSLSGGERSLIILARAIVDEKKIIIIDEVLSELSVELEKEVLNNLKENISATIIYISHKKTDVFKRIINVGKE